jgi:hypothetical protein
MARDDRVAAEVQRPVDLDELHRPPVLGEDGERRVPDVLAPGRKGVRRDGRDRRWAVHACEAKAVDDVLRLDLRPHHDAHRRELVPHFGHLLGERALRVVDLLGPIEKHIPLLGEAGALLRAERRTAIPDRKTACAHGASPCRAAWFEMGEAVVTTLPRRCDIVARCPSFAAGAPTTRAGERSWRRPAVPRPVMPSGRLRRGYNCLTRAEAPRPGLVSAGSRRPAARSQPRASTKSQCPSRGRPCRGSGTPTS